MITRDVEITCPGGIHALVAQKLDVYKRQRLTGITVLARFRPFDEFDGHPLASIDASADRRFTRSVRLAIDNARDNYLEWTAGQTPPEPPGPLAQIADSIRRVLGRGSKHARVTAGTPRPATQRIPLPQPR